MVTAFKVSKNLNNITLEEHVSSLRSCEIELEEVEPLKKGKFVALKSNCKSKKTKAFQAEEEESDEEDEALLLSKRISQLWKQRQ